MATRSYPLAAFLLLALTLCSCSDSDTCPCSPGRGDPPLSDLRVGWDRGVVYADLMPVTPPDPVVCRAWLVLENRNPDEAFSGLEIPAAEVVLAEADSVLGSISLQTNWDGLLAPGASDTILFYKDAGSGTSIGAPCGELILLDFLIRNADGETTVFRPDTLRFQCAF